MYTNINKKIKMMALFENGKIIPKVFRYEGRDYKIKEISIVYQEREGRSINHYFSVETEDGNVFKLRYNDEKLTWWLDEIWGD
jgi:hypothetical protein